MAVAPILFSLSRAPSNSRLRVLKKRWLVTALPTTDSEQRISHIESLFFSFSRPLSFLLWDFLANTPGFFLFPLLYGAEVGTKSIRLDRYDTSGWVTIHRVRFTGSARFSASMMATGNKSSLDDLQHAQLVPSPKWNERLPVRLTAGGWGHQGFSQTRGNNELNTKSLRKIKGGKTTFLSTMTISPYRGKCHNHAVGKKKGGRSRRSQQGAACRRHWLSCESSRLVFVAIEAQARTNSSLSLSATPFVALCRHRPDRCRIISTFCDRPFRFIKHFFSSHRGKKKRTMQDLAYKTFHFLYFGRHLALFQHENFIPLLGGKEAVCVIIMK